MKRIVTLVLFTLIVSLLAACGSGDKADTDTTTETETTPETITETETDPIIEMDPNAINVKQSYTDFAGKNIGVIAGNPYYYTSERIGAVPVNYSQSSAVVDDMRQGKVDGYINTLSVVRALVVQHGGDTFKAIAVPTDVSLAQIGGVTYDQAMAERFNAFLAIISNNGTLWDMKNRWLNADPDAKVTMPVIPGSTGLGVLRVVTTSDAKPYSYIGDDGNLQGFSIELALRFGANEGMTVVFSDIDPDKLIPLISGQGGDIGLANSIITERNERQVYFTNPICEEQPGILTMKALSER